MDRKPKPAFLLLQARGDRVGDVIVLTHGAYLLGDEQRN
jgi:hypothetical protein